MTTKSPTGASVRPLVVIAGQFRGNPPQLPLSGASASLHGMRTHLAVLVAIALLPACWGAAPSLPSAVGGEPAVALVLRVDDATLNVGDKLAFEATVVNKGSRRIVVVPPLDGSWVQFREPQYRFVWEADNSEVIQANGWGPQARCGLTNPITDADRLKVAPGASAPLAAKGTGWGAPPFVTEVFPSARPGTYRVRLEYRAEALDGVTPLTLRSNPVEVVLEGGDPKLWACRSTQVHDRDNHSWTELSPGDVVPFGDGLLVIATETTHSQTDAVRSMRGRLLAQRFDASLEPVGQPLVVATQAGAATGYAQAVRVPGGFLVVHTPGPVGGRSVELTRLTLGAAGLEVAGRRTLSPAPGNPYVVSVRRVGDRIAILHDGPGDDEPLLLTILDARGAPVESVTVADKHVGTGALTAHATGFVTLHRAGGVHYVASSFDADGDRVEQVDLRIDTNSLEAVETGPKGHQVVYHDNSLSGSDAQDTMGMYVAQLGPDWKPIAVRPITPLSRTKPYFGTAAWSGGNLLRMYLDDKKLQVGTRKGDTVLATDAGGSWQLRPRPGGFAAIWSDHRDDSSRACRELGNCASEVYVALVDITGKLLHGPVRATQNARAQPFAPFERDWKRTCAK